MSDKCVQDLVGAARGMPGADSAELYSDTAAQVCRRSLHELFQVVRPLGLYEEQTVLDIGCGTGEATSSLMNRVSGVKEIYAVDRSSKFISYAKQINRDIDILYKQMDAEDEWPEAWKNKFTMVFSNYVLHWIKDHTNLLRNINRCTKVNADIVVQFFHSAEQGNNEMEAARRAAKDCGILEEMQAAFGSIQKNKPVWKDANAYSKLFSSLGFKVKICRVEERKYKCASRFERAGMTATVSPIMNMVPEDKKLLFATKYVQYVEDPYTICHKAVVVHAVKVTDI